MRQARPPAGRRPGRPEGNPYRAKALGYLRDGRVTVWWLEGLGGGAVPTGVSAHIEPAQGDPSGSSVWANVWLKDGAWGCDEHPGGNSCAHRLAIQMVTGHGHLGGRSRA